MKIIILGLIITASILILYASISDMMNFEIQNTDIGKDEITEDDI